MSGQHGIRLVLADVDGTLVTDDKVLTGAAIEAVRALRAAGIEFAITSSRPPRGMRMLFAPLALESIVAGLNGGVYANPDLSIIKTYPLDLALAKLAVNAMLGGGLDVWIYTQDEWLVRDQAAPHVAREEWIVKFDAKAVPSFTDAHLARAVKIVGVSDDPALLAASEKAARNALGEKASVACSQAYYIDVTCAQANKGAVVTMLSQRMNIPPEQIATIGDMPTDAFMFRNSGFSIAMGNASDAVKAQASAVTGTNQNEGFAHAMDKFILHPAAA
jgi:Cof subfamily protein (haloacid dehalogenase superfamily)